MQRAGPVEEVRQIKVADVVADDDIRIRLHHQILST